MSSQLIYELETGLDRITAQLTDPLEKLVESLKMVKDAMARLMRIADAYPFADEAAEIFCFKYVKPAIQCYQIYCTEMYTIEKDFPLGDIEKQLVCLEEEQLYLERYCKKYAFLYHYYRTDATELDTLYFVRGKMIDSLLLPNNPEINPSFSTACDYHFAKFRAFDLLKAWIQEKLRYLKVNPSKGIEGFGKAEIGELQWTGDAIKLAELGYGLYHSGQLNSGSAGIGQIFRWLEEKLGISIGIPAKRFAEIKARKRLSRTRFMDEMKDALLHKMDQDERYGDSKTRRPGDNLD